MPSLSCCQPLLQLINFRSCYRHLCHSRQPEESRSSNSGRSDWQGILFTVRYYLNWNIKISHQPFNNRISRVRMLHCGIDIWSHPQSQITSQMQYKSPPPKKQLDFFSQNRTALEVTLRHSYRKKKGNKTWTVRYQGKHKLTFRLIQ